MCVQDSEDLGDEFDVDQTTGESPGGESCAGAAITQVMMIPVVIATVRAAK